MEPIPFEVGRVVVSRAGRDKGAILVVLAVSAGGRVLAADGRTRFADHPKCKNVKHLTAKPQRIDEIAEKLAAGKPVLNEDLRRGLAAVGYADT